jgi:hypothetical protein
MKHENRESWLEAAIELSRPWFEGVGYVVPKVRVSCGWPSVRGLSKKNKRVGECWDKSAADDSVAQIFISPFIVDPLEVISILVHEEVHAVVGCKEGHNKVFGKCARAVGLEAKLTSTESGEELLRQSEKWIKELGGYPHAKLDGMTGPTKKQGTRMVKCECAECGYVCRTTRKWIEEVGAPHCPKHGTMGCDV